MLDEPTNPNDNIPPDEGYNEEPTEEVPAEASNNRAFWIVGGIIGGLILLTLAGIAAFIFLLAPRLAAQRNTAAQSTAAANAVLIQQLTATAQAALWTPTSQPSPTPSNTAIPTLAKASATPVVAISTATTGGGIAGSSDAATLAFLQTQLAGAMTSTAGALLVAPGVTNTPGGALATTGFFDEVGLPTLGVLTLALLAVIFLARRLRGAPAR